MSSTCFTKIENTVVNGQSLVSSLSGSDVNALLFAGALDRNPIVTATTANVALTAPDFIQAAISEQLVNGSGLTAAWDLTVGADAASNARFYINLFNLSSGLGQKVITHWQVDGKVNAAFATNLANTSGTHVYVNVSLNSGADAATQVLFPASSLAGAVATVEVWASNVTSGSEVINFNVCQGNPT